MRELLHDIALSFCPESVKRVHRPSSPSRVLLAAVLTGPLQTLLFGKWFISGYLAFLGLRGRQLAPAVERMNVTTQGWFVALLSIEYVVFHPLALLRLYLAAEGFIRFVGAIAAAEVVPSLPVVLFFKMRKYLQERRIQRDLEPLVSIPDSLERLSDGERLRIKTAFAKAGWNKSIIIGVDGEWYEVEREERGAFPRTHVYILRRAPVGKILRGYDEYDSTAAIKGS